MVKQSTLILDDVFHALGNPARRQILDTLAEGQRTVGELAAPLDMSLAAASKHIHVLERAGLVFRTRSGRKQICQLNPKPLSNARDWLRHYERFWNDRLDALELALQMADDNAGEKHDGSK
jgi:DNA-binding transcriptional ArsR family regulator